MKRDIAQYVLPIPCPRYFLKYTANIHALPVRLRIYRIRWFELILS